MCTCQPLLIDSLVGKNFIHKFTHLMMISLPTETTQKINGVTCDVQLWTSARDEDWLIILGSLFTHNLKWDF